MDINCRLAKLEQKVDGLFREVTEDKIDVAVSMKNISDKLSSIIETQSKQKGFFSGVAFVISGIVGLVSIGIAIMTGKFN